MTRNTKKNKKHLGRGKEKTPEILANIKVVGIGGGGGHAVARMSRNFIRGVEFIAINTDHQDLDQCGVRRKIYIGRNLTKGLGTGMNPDLGRQAAEENRSEIAEVLGGADLVFIAAGLGGGTGSGGAPIVAEVAKQGGALAIAVVTKPFAFEGAQRDRIAREGLVKLKDKVDAIIVVPNDRIFSVISKDTPLVKAFDAIDDVLRNALNGIVELIISPGIINLDFADVKTIIQDAGAAVIGVGVGSGAERAQNAVNLALNSPLLETTAEGAKAVLLGVSGGRDLKMNEVNDAAKVVAQAVDPGARIIFGAYHDRNLRPNHVKVTLIATGLNGGGQPNSLFPDRVSDKRQSCGVVNAEPAYGDDKAKQGAADSRKMQVFKSKPESNASQPIEKQKEKGSAEKAEAVKNDSEWDFPTFLRKKKRDK